MTTSGTELREAIAQSLTVTDDSLAGDLADGRTITVPLAWYPRLAHGTPAERANWRLIGRGVGIHWFSSGKGLEASRGRAGEFAPERLAWMPKEP